MASERGRGRGRGRGGGERSEDPNLYEQLKKGREDIFELKQRAYKSALWALRIDHQKINWRLEEAIGELKKALNITDEVHDKLVQELDNEFSEAGDEAKRRVDANRNVIKDKGVAPISKSTSSKKKKANEDEDQNPRTYNENIVGKVLSIKWAGDGKFKEVLVIDYDMENGNHSLYHINEKLYEWLDLKEMLPEDIRWDHSRGSSRGGRGGRGGRGSGRGGRGFNQGIGESSQTNFQREGHSIDEFELYDIEQLSNMVMKVLDAPTPELLKEAEKHLEKQRHYLTLGLEAIAYKAASLGAEGTAQKLSVPHDHGGRSDDIRHGGQDDDGSDDGNRSGDDETESDDVRHGGQDDDGSDDGNRSGDDETESDDGGNTNSDDDKRGTIASDRSRSTGATGGSGSSSSDYDSDD